MRQTVRPVARHEVVRRLLREPLTRQARAGLLYTIIGLPLGIVGFVFTVATVALGAYTAITLVGLPLIGLSTLGVRRLAAAHRRLALRLLGVRIPEPPDFRPRPGFLGWIRSALTDPFGWRARAYLVLEMPVAAFSFLIAGYLWVVGAYYVTYPVWWEVFHRFTFHPASSATPAPVLSTPLPIPGFAVLTLPAAFGICALGIVALLIAPWATSAVNAADLSLMSGLLGRVTLFQRLRDLESSRANVVDDSAARLRSIERDLHDGAQAHLVAVTMKLGLAKEKLLGLDTAGGQPDVDRALELVDTAQSTAQVAMAELRGLARGIHPAVLDTGLDAALASLTARSAVPVEAIVDVPDRPSQAIESIAYFCAAELLANVGKHSGARHAVLEAVHIQGLLRVRVTDDGCGGASLQAGGGLKGLAERIRAVDGRLEISSPRGGPTVVTVELPT